MIKSNSRNLRANLGDYLGRVRYGHERVTVTSHGKPVAAIVPIHDLELLERIEDELDIQTVDRRRDEELIPWEEVKKVLARGT